MLRTLFYIGVLAPAVLVVFLFVIFLVCWFKCNLRERIYQKIGKGHNSTQSSIADAKDFQNGRPPANVLPSKEYLDNEDNESRCGSVRIMNHNIVQYVPGEFPYLKRDTWRYMSTKAVDNCRSDPTVEKKAPPVPPVWTTSTDSLSSLDSETAMTLPWLSETGQDGRRYDSKIETNNRTIDRNRNSYKQPKIDQKSPIKINLASSHQGETCSSDSSMAAGTGLNRHYNGPRPIHVSTNQCEQQHIRGYNYNQTSTMDKVGEKTYPQLLENTTNNELLKDNRLLANSNPCPKLLLLDSQDLATSTDVDAAYRPVMPNFRGPVMSV